MSVCLQFPTFRDIVKFIQINTKCYETVKMLKVNPFFASSPYIKQFCKYFKPTTINLLSYYIFDSELFSNIECIKRPAFEFCVKEKHKEIQIIIPKIKSFNLYHNNEQTKFFIENAQLFNNIQRITGDLTQIILFMKKYSNNGVIKNISFPKVIDILLDNDEVFDISLDIVNKVKELKLYIPDLKETIIYLQFYQQPKIEEKNLLIQLQNIHYSYCEISNSENELIMNNYANTLKYIILREVHYPNQLKDLLEKIYSNHCVLNYIENFCKDNCIWYIPSFITICEIAYTDFTTFNINSNVNTILFDMKYITNLTLSSCNKVILSNQFSSLKYLNIVNCSSVCFHSREKNIFKYCLNEIEKIHIQNCDTIQIDLTSSSLQILIIDNSNTIEINGSISNLIQLYISYSNKCKFPQMSFENKQIYIEHSQMSFNSISPLKFMNIELSDFIKLTQNYIDLPFHSIQLNQSLFRVKRFITYFFKGISINNNHFVNIQKYPFHPLIQLISNGFYGDSSNYTNQLIYSNGKQIQFPSTIHYFEVEIFGYSIVQIGLFDKNNYDPIENSSVCLLLFSTLII
ncbi:B30.2/SPRY domain-containing protein [Entamoeba marina]